MISASFPSCDQDTQATKEFMDQRHKPVRVLYSFPHKLGADRICTTAWQQVDGLAVAGADILVCPGAVSRPLPPGIRVRSTLARGRVRIPYKVLGRMRAFALHDYIVSRRLEKMASQLTSFILGH